MNKLLRHPATNAVGIGLFSLFYGIVFLTFSGILTSQTGQSASPFWRAWDAFLTHGGHRFAAIALLLITAAVIAFLLTRHRPYDEYHTTILIKCLALSVLFTLAGINLLAIVVLCDPVGILSKLTLFFLMDWATVVLADVTYLLLCRKQ